MCSICVHLTNHKLLPVLFYTNAAYKSDYHIATSNENQNILHYWLNYKMLVIIVPFSLFLFLFHHLLYVGSQIEFVVFQFGPALLRQYLVLYGQLYGP